MSLDLITDRMALQDLMLQYASSVDERDQPRYRACFADDVTVVNFSEDDIHGIDAWIKHVWGALEAYSSTQHLLSPMHAIVDGDVADTSSDVQATHILVAPEGDSSSEPAGQPQPQRFILWGGYRSQMRRIAGEWKIQRHELVIRGTGS